MASVLQARVVSPVHEREVRLATYGGIAELPTERSVWLAGCLQVFECSAPR